MVVLSMGRHRNQLDNQTGRMEKFFGLQSQKMDSLEQRPEAERKEAGMRFTS